MSFSVVFMTVDVRIALKFSGGRGGCNRSIKQPVFKTCLPWEMLVAA